MAVILLHKSYLNVDGTTYTIRDPEALHAEDASTFFQDDSVKAALLDLIHPIGSLYISDDSTDPGTLFGGTWTQIKDMFILAAGDNYEALSEGGYADAVNIAHSHSMVGTSSSAGGHAHAVAGTTGSAGEHTHPAGSDGTCFSRYSGTRTTDNVGELSGSGYKISRVSSDSSWGGMENTGSEGEHTHTFAATAQYTGAHTHNIHVTCVSSGSSGTGRNMPPYHTSYVWKRTA